MKPIEKYKERAIALLKEAELGEHLTIKVSSRPLPKDVNANSYYQNNAYCDVESSVYEFELHTNNYVI